MPRAQRPRPSASRVGRGRRGRRRRTRTVLRSAGRVMVRSRGAVARGLARSSRRLPAAPAPHGSSSPPRLHSRAGRARLRSRRSPRPTAASFHASGKSPSIRSSERSDGAETCSAWATARPPPAASSVFPSAAQDSRQLTRRRRVALEQRRSDVREGGRGRVAEADRLLDLERERDAVAVDAAVVLDRHEPEEPVELAGSTSLLGRGERRGAESLELPLDGSDGALDLGAATSQRGALETSECRVQALGRGDAPLRAVAWLRGSGRTRG